MKALIPQERIEKYIYLIRGYKVMLDSDLANLYDVETKALNRAVKRNAERFPNDFCFQLSSDEYNTLRCHFGTLEEAGPGKHRKYLPYLFTEQGVAMLSSVLKSKKAALVNVQIIRTFVRLREMLVSNKELSRKLATLEKKHDQQFKVVFDAIRQLMEPPKTKKRQIGFVRNSALQKKNDV
jgi:hypothetical protein